LLQFLSIRTQLEQWPKSLERLLEKFQASRGATDGIKDFISVLMLYREHGAEDVNAAVELALERGISASSVVKHILVQATPGVDFAPLPNWPATLPADVSIYGQLGGLQ
jgi:hypothetical protein